MMDALTRLTQQAEKPGRLHLAILEWQRQLIAREAQSIGSLKEPDYERLARSWSA
jgi:ABC-type enterochelin transport system substrate-binding protein